MLFGAAALIASVIYFWAGPFVEPPPLEQVGAEKAVAIRDSTIAKLRGKELPLVAPESRWTSDRLFQIGTVTLGAFALVLGAFGFAKRESRRAILVAAALGAGAIAFQFLAAALGVIAVVVFLGVLLGIFGLS